MDAARLEEYLRSGLSLEQVAALTGRHASTVGYWVKRHGLSAVHRDRHAAKGGIDRTTLSALVDEGLSTREIAERVGLSQSTVRHWLRAHDLRTHRARKQDAHGVRGLHVDRKELECPRHGRTEFWLESRGIYRCLSCRSEAVSRRRRKLKEILVRKRAGAATSAVTTAGSARSSSTTATVSRRSSASRIAASRDRWRPFGPRPRSAFCCAQTAIPRWRQVWSKWPDGATVSAVAQWAQHDPG
jgi:transposase